MTISETRPTDTQGTVLEGIRSKVFMDRYSLKDENGTALETTPEEMWRRVARGIAAVETTEEKRTEWEERFYEVMDEFKFVPGGRILSGAGTGFAVTYFNCYVIPSPDDSRGGILENLKYLTEIMARGGGVGVNLSTLRPRGSYIKSVNGTSSGPVSWAELYSVITGRVIQQGGTRRGALMIMLDDDHPDIEEFIAAKQIDPLTNKPVMIEHANVSVAVSNAFMQAVKEDGDWQLQFPTRAAVAADPSLASKVKIHKTIKAREAWDLICTRAWTTAEPGLVFMDRYNERSNTWYYENIRCVNPCVTGDTLVYTSAGLYPAAELAEIAAPVTVVAPAPDGVALRQASHVFPTGVKPVYRLTTTEGYTLRLTANHQVLTDAGWKEAQHLIAGDKLTLLNGTGGFGTTGNADQGQILGWLIGDGHINRSGQQTAVLSFFGTERAIAPQFAEAVNRVVAAPEGVRHYHVGVQEVKGRDESRVASVRLMRFIDPELLEEKLQVPPSVYRGSRAMQRGFLAALFTADGSVQGTREKGVSVRLTSISATLLEGVQRLLLNFGIASRIYRDRRRADVRALPDGKGGTATYPTQAYHDLIISRSNVPVFADQISFLTEEKQAKLADYLTERTRGFYREDFLATFAALTPDGEEMVYDLTEPEAHRFVANGLVIHNCGEQGLPAWGVCNLGALNLSAYVSGPVGAGTFDYDSLANDSRVAIRFLDNVVDANEYFLEENAAAQLGTRRTGLGTMGLADALIKMGVAYGSPESTVVIEKIYRVIRDSAYDMSADIAAEKGPCPHFDFEKYPQGQFIRELPDPIQAKIQAKGIRNAVLLTQAPTGTTSLLSGVSSGIEPVFSFAMKRVDRTGEHIMYHELMKAWLDANPGQEAPDYFVSSSSLTPEGHIAVQATVQRFTDSSISKTVNAPNDHTVEEVKRLYMAAFDQGCKGVTYYRDGSRDAVLTHVKDEKKADEAKPEAQPAADVWAYLDGVLTEALAKGTLSGEQVAEAHARLTTKPVPALPAMIRARPAVLHGYTRNIKAPEGTVNITVNSDEVGPLEIFVNVGRSGSDVAALAEALGRLISISLRIPSPMSQENRLREMVSQLRGIGGSRTIGFGPEQVRSLPDAVGKALDEHLDGHPSLQPNPMQLPLLHGAASAAPTPAPAAVSAYSNGQTNGNGNGHGYTNGQGLADLTTYKMTGNICPECGSSTLVYEEGCKKCVSCGHSEC